MSADFSKHVLIHPNVDSGIHWDQTIVTEKGPISIIDMTSFWNTNKIADSDRVKSPS